MASPLALQSSRTAAIDRLRTADTSAFVQALGVVGFALLTALGAQFQLRIYLWEVPITLQTLAVYGSGLFLGARNGMLSQMLYLALGFFIPVYAGDGSGATYFATAPTAGYLIGYPLAALAIGALSQRWKTLPGAMLAVLVGSAVLFTCGVAWLHFAADHASWMVSIERGWLRFVAIDFLKIAAVGLGYAGMRRL